MLTKRQIAKIKKSLANGTGSDIKISKTQIRSSVKHGGNLFTSLASLGAKILPYAIKGVAKVAPALATGAATALGELSTKKLFGKGGAFGAGITIPKKFIPVLPPFAGEFTKSQIDLVNKVFKTGGRLVIKPTRQQIEGGFLGTIASIGIPMAISLVSKIFGSGLQVDKGSSSNTRNVYVPQPPPPTSTHCEGNPYQPPPFIGTWENPIAMGVKKKLKGKGVKKKAQRQRTTIRKKQPIQLNSNTRRHFLIGEPMVPPMTPSLEHAKKHFVIRPLSNFDLMEWEKKLGINHLRGNTVEINYLVRLKKNVE